MIKMMEPSKALVAIDTLSSFIPIGHNVPDQAVLRIALNLPQTLLTAIAALRPSRTLFQVEGRVPDKNRCCGALCRDVYRFLGKRFRTGYESLAAVHEIGMQCRNNAGKKKAGHHSQDRNREKSKYCHKYLLSREPNFKPSQRAPGFSATRIVTVPVK
jgi:hypothetical protein